MNKKEIPYRIDLAGGWLDQPFVSRYYPGSVITISIEPTHEFHLRSGMATSTRNLAKDLWPGGLPAHLSFEKTAQILFGAENPPGTKYVSGSQDSIGIVFPGANNLFYSGEYWPEEIESTNNQEVLDWLEKNIYLVPLWERNPGYNVLETRDISFKKAKRLAEASKSCWKCLNDRDVRGFGSAITKSLEAQIAMFPNMTSREIQEQIEMYRKKCYGYKLSGAGGGGYLILVTDKEIPDSIKIKIRRK